MPPSRESGTPESGTPESGKRATGKTEADEGVEGEALARLVADVCERFRAQDLVVLDVRDRTSITDFFVLATCGSGRQMATLAEELRVTAKRSGNQPLSLEGTDSSWWVLLDLNDVVVHLFTAEARRYYDLEILWGDAPRLDVQEVDPEEVDSDEDAPDESASDGAAPVTPD